RLRQGALARVAVVAGAGCARPTGRGRASRGRCCARSNARGRVLAALSERPARKRRAGLRGPFGGVSHSRLAGEDCGLYARAMRALHEPSVHGALLLGIAFTSLVSRSPARAETGAVQLAISDCAGIPGSEIANLVAIEV